MQYMLLIYGDPSAAPDFDSADREAKLAAWNTYTQAMLDADVHRGEAALQPTPTATTVRGRDGETLTVTVRSRRPKRSSAASTCSTSLTSMPPWSGRARRRTPATVRWRSAP